MHWRGLTSSLVVAALIAGAGIPFAANANEQTNRDRVNLPAEQLAIARYQAHDQILQNVGWKLARSNARFCDNAIPSIGLQLQDMASYGSPDIARRVLGLTGDFAVQTVAKGSPAALSGLFAQNREIALVAGTDLGSWEAEERFEWRRLTRAHDYLDAVLAQNGAVEITFADQKSAALSPVFVCPSRFELLGKSQKAVANGKRVAIGIDFPAFQYDEAEFAAVVAHELAHNLLGHTAWLDRNGRGRGNTRMTESEADRLMPWLLINAGYDPAAAARFFKEFQPSSGGLPFVGGTHPRWQERVEAVQTEIAQIREVSAGSPTADWRTHFRREIDPEKGL